MAKMHNTKEALEKLREKDNRLIKGTFECFDPPGGTMPILLRKHAGDPVFNKKMKHGEVYEVPIMVMNHINSCVYRKNKYITDSQGNVIVSESSPMVRCKFSPIVDWEQVPTA